jgi:DNA invertase Pin-like site-specific DNA recombinase
VKGVLSVEDWTEIRRLHRAEQMPVKAIARAMGISRSTGGDDGTAAGRAADRDWSWPNP